MTSRFRLFLALALAVSLTSSAGGQSIVRKPPRGEARPSVLFITIDTLRADHLGCYGYKQIDTPNIDALAADGIRMQRAYTPVPITLPSHTVLFTGTYPMLNGMHDFSGNRLNPAQPKLASVLKEQGYSTGAVIGAAVLDSRFGLNRGFDFYYDHFDFNRLLETNLDQMERPGNVVVDQALSWLEKNDRKPFFLWVHIYDPHDPYRPPPPYSEMYRDRPYDGEIAFADAQVGRLLQFLKRRGLYQKVLIVLTGDHGEGLGEHGERTHGFFIYNSTLHVPLIFKPVSSGRTVVRQAATIPSAVSLVDLMPTLLDMLGIATPAGVQGHSFRALLDRKAVENSSPLYAESFLPRLHFNWSELRAIEEQNYRFIDGPKPELYDLATDPNEQNNLIADKKAVASELKARLRSIISQYSAGTELAEKTGMDPALAERLKALGYTAFSGGGDPSASNYTLPDPKDRIQVYEKFAEAMSDSQHGHYDDAIQKLTPLLELEPSSVPIRYLLGSTYYRTRQFANAIGEFERVLKLSPDYSLANYYLALSYGNNGDYATAVRYFERTLELDETNFSAAFNLGSAYLKLGRVDDALSAFQRSVTIYPEYAEGYRALGEVLLYRREVDPALTALRRAAELAPSDPKIHASLARALEAKGLTDEAQREMEKARNQR
jgi:arylsulfatase A-like enzyme/cytochrome c-type biogenesis protein CcmH/NrfG